MRRILALILLFVLLTAGTAAAATSHTVQAGETLYEIAQRYGVSVRELRRANPAIDPDLIYPGQQIQIPVDEARALEQEVVRLVNRERAARGLAPLAANEELSEVARLKAEDMRDKGYVAHRSPTYGSLAQMLRRFGVRYGTAGENIAAGQASAREVVQSWMGSPGHRPNILDPAYTEIGVGYARGGEQEHYWAQLFIGP